MRYLPLTRAQREEMLQAIGTQEVEDLFHTVPSHLLLKRELHLPRAQSESEILSSLSDIATRNQTFPLNRNFAGAGVYNHYVPAVVDSISSRGEFLTAYTPYQPEISQGTLQTIYEFQTMMTRLLGTEFCNASHYDGATATAEACAMALRIKSKKSKIVFVGEMHPLVKRVVTTYLSHLPHAVKEVTSLSEISERDTAALVVSQPSFHGQVQSLDALAEAAHRMDALLICHVPNPTAFGIFSPPSQADLVSGEASCLGNSPMFGGPLLGFVGGKLEHARQAPGRLIGKTTDDRGRVVYTITLATREQHIRRERATSNICTNEGLCLVRAAIHLAMLGKTGMERLALATHGNLLRFREGLTSAGIETVTVGTAYQELCLRLKHDANAVAERALSEGILLGVPVSRTDPQCRDRHQLLVCFNETHDETAIARWFEVYAKVTAT